jgi:hypothetical protein
VAAFPFFSSFGPAKAIVAGVLLAAALLTTCRTRAWNAAGAEVVAGPAAQLMQGSILAFLFLVVSLPALLFAHDAGLALRAAHLDLAGVATYLVATYVAHEECFLPRLASWVSMAVLLVAVPAALEVVLGQPLLGYALLPGGATLGNPDLAAELVAVALPAALLSVIHGRGAGRWLGVSAIATGILLLVLIPSATARLALAGAGLMAVASGIARRPRPWLWRAIPALLVLAVCIAAAVYFVGEGRLHLYRTAADCAMERPISGHGVGGFPGCFLEHQATRVAEDPGLLPWWTNARHAHDEWLHLWAERGLSAPLVLLVLFGLAWATAMRSGAWWAASGIVAAAVCATGSVSLAHYPGRILAFLWLGLACGQAFRWEGESKEQPFPAKPGEQEIPHPTDRSEAHRLRWLGRTVGALRLRRVGSRPAWLDGEAGSGEEPGGAGGGVRRIGAKLTGCDGSAEPRVRCARGVMAPGPAWWLVAAFLVLAPIWSAGIDFLYVRGEYGRVLDLEGSHAGASLRLGQALADSGNTGAGCRLIEQALVVSPDLNTAVAAGVCRAREGDLDAAIAHLETAVRWHPRFGTAYADLAEVYRQAGRQEEAWRHITRAVSLWPGRKDFERIRRAVCSKNPFCLPDRR